MISLVAAYNRTILDHAAASGIDVSMIHFSSDGAGGQLKNHFTLSLLLRPELLHADAEEIDWSFFATSHSKGPVDGVGGTVKHADDQTLRQMTYTDLEVACQQHSHLASQHPVGTVSLSVNATSVFPRILFV